MLRSQLQCRHRGTVAVGVTINLAAGAPQPVFNCSHSDNVEHRCAIKPSDDPSVSWNCSSCVLAESRNDYHHEEPAAVPRMAHKTRVIEKFGRGRADSVRSRSSMQKENGWGWVSIEQMLYDVRTLLIPKIPTDVRAVAGCPRSGMAAAAYLSTALHVPLLAVGKDGRLAEIGSGSRGRMPWSGDQKNGPVLVVEDSVYSGTALEHVRLNIGTPAVFAAIYERPRGRFRADINARELPSPHFFEWHFFNSGHMNGRMSHPGLQGGTALDMDGIICEEPQAADEPEEKYAAWLRTARPLWLPRTIPCRAIITGRFEKFREITVEWLARHHVKYDKLIMAQPSDRRDIAAWKASKLKELRCSTYVESGHSLSYHIHSLWGGIVVCPPTETMWVPASLTPEIESTE